MRTEHAENAENLATNGARHFRISRAQYPRWFEGFEHGRPAWTSNYESAHRVAPDELVRFVESIERYAGSYTPSLVLHSFLGI